MKTLVLLILLSLTLSARAQTGVYHPFPDSGAVWCSYGGSMAIICSDYSFTYMLDEHVLINGNMYNRLRHYGTITYTDCFSSTLNVIIDSTTYYIRQDILVKKVWIYDSVKNKEKTLYDFNLKIGDTLDTSRVYWASGTSIVTSIDSILIDGNYRKRFNYSNGCQVFTSDSFLIEGIGSSHGLMTSPPCIGSTSHLSTFIQNNRILIGDSVSLNDNCHNFNIGINENEHTTFVTLSPNPFHTTATLEIKNKELKNAELRIYNVMGRLVQQHSIVNRNSKIINREGLVDGIYFYQLINESGQVMSGKFVVE